MNMKIKLCFQVIENGLAMVREMSGLLQVKLMESMYRHEYMREASDLRQWVQEQSSQAASEDYGTDYEHLLVRFGIKR